MYLVISGQSFYMAGTNMIKIIHGKAFYKALYWLRLVKFCIYLLSIIHVYRYYIWQTFKHIFTSPSSVEREAKATGSENAHIHGMTSVTLPSIAYAATQVHCFLFVFISIDLLLPITGQICIVFIRCIQ